MHKNNFRPEFACFSDVNLTSEPFKDWIFFSLHSWLYLLQWKGTKQNKRKKTWAKSRGNQAQASKSTLSVESPGHTEFLQENVATTQVKYSLPGTFIRDSVSKGKECILIGWKRLLNVLCIQKFNSSSSVLQQFLRPILGTLACNNNNKM